MKGKARVILSIQLAWLIHSQKQPQGMIWCTKLVTCATQLVQAFFYKAMVFYKAMISENMYICRDQFSHEDDADSVSEWHKNIKHICVLKGSMTVFLRKMANLSHCALPVAVIFILLSFLSLTFNNWSPHICNTEREQENLNVSLDDIS